MAYGAAAGTAALLIVQASCGCAIMRSMVMPRCARRLSLPLLSLLVLLVGSPSVSMRLLAQAAAPNRIDTVAPMAPELAPYGSHDIGVRTLRVTDPQRIDVLKTSAGAPPVRSDRTLVIEAWYPAQVPPGTPRTGTYDALVRDGRTRVTLHGRAVREAPPEAGLFPLVILSHGYPGTRYLMSHLGENLASKGYVVVSIDHTDSTYDQQLAFASTLYNRSLDQLFVLKAVAGLAAAGSGDPLAGHVDVSRVGLVGYSMGGYGVVNTIGGGYADAATVLPTAPPNGLLRDRAASNPGYRASRDARIRAAVAIGPWGMQAGFWDAAGLAGIEIPTLFVAGSADEVSGYEKGTQAMFEGAINADRYLLTFADAGHNAAAPYPAPREAIEGPAQAAFGHHADPVWDTVRMNNILQHFTTAFFGQHLKGDAGMQSYLTVVPQGRAGVWAVDREGTPQPAHTYWKGFKRGTALGLSLEHRTPAPARSPGQ